LKAVTIYSSGKAKKVISPETWTALPLYNQPEFLDLVAPGKGFFARIEDRTGVVAWFPFTGQKILWKWRIFQVGFCQRFEPFSEKGTLDSEHWAIWFLFCKTQTFQCRWPFSGTDGQGLNEIGLQIKVNQILPLNQPFSQILSNWKPGRRGALTKSQELTIEAIKSADFGKCLQMLLKATSDNRWKPSGKEQATILKIAHSPHFAEHLIFLRAIENGMDVSLVLILRWKNRFHYLFSLSSDAGLKQDAITRIFYNFFEQQSGTDFIFDFEGSSLPGVHAFFKSFGAGEEDYFLIQK